MSVPGLLLQLARLREENALLRARVEAIPGPHRPRYTPWERLQILAYQVMHGVGIAEAAKTFAVTETTVRRWWKDARDDTEVLVRPPRPVTTKARLIEELTCLLRLALPLAFGTRTLAGHLYRMGLATSRSSVQRILKRKPKPPDEPGFLKALAREYAGFKAKYFGHVFVLDFTRSPSLEDLWIGGVLDLFSRAIVATKSRAGPPTAKFATALLDNAIANAGRPPKHSISDKGVQFKSKRFKRWLRRYGIKHRYGAVGSSRSIGLQERFWRTLKCEWATVWLCWAARPVLERRLREWVAWYNEHRVHRGVGGRTPDEVERGQRRRRPLGVKPEDRWLLVREEFCGQKHMPVYRLRKSA